MSVIESTVDGRYQIITHVASGGMGQVFRAHDAVLDREVALKLLHPQFAGDHGFVDRFRREARAAAVLNHPNVVGVYDWGLSEGTYFMVMEFVRGQSLRALLSEYGRLEPAQVAEVTLQVLAALEHAHGHGIVHRDIKPENILIAEDGTVKVADFGLARAFADSHVSQTEGTVTGTVQYLAPEQVHGEPADPRTDLYALGVVMFELLTGQPPYSGETSVAIAYRHLSDRVPPPSQLAPAATEGLDAVVQHATEKDRAHRPASARAFRDELLHAMGTLPSAIPVAVLAAQAPVVELVPEERAATVTIPRALSPRARRRRLVRRLGVLAAALVVLAGGGWAAWVYAIPHYSHVPSTERMTVLSAESALRAAGYPFTVGDAMFSHSIPAGQVVRTNPPQGTRARTRTRVTIIPSKGPDFRKIPTVIRFPLAQATTRLKSAGFTVKVLRRYDETVPKVSVIEQNPSAGHELERGQAVTVVVSLGPAPVKIPDLTSQPVGAASTTLTNMGLQPVVIEEFSVTVPKGDVIRTEPGPGTEVAKDSPVTLVASKGPQAFPMPDVSNQTRQHAVQLLETYGLVVDVITIPQTTGTIVVLQLPAPGSIVHQGDHVRIYLGGF